jgi:hypothetical protein
VDGVEKLGTRAKGGGMNLSVEYLPSPNHGPRPAGAGVRGVIIHATAGRSERGDVEWCLRSKADHDAQYERDLRAFRERDEASPRPFRYSPVSYHYIVGRTGKVYQLVQESRRAWHAGRSHWMGRDDCNDFTVGVALSHHPDEAKYPAAQLDAAATIVADILGRRGLDARRMAGHHEVSPRRKLDPFPWFPWGHFARAVTDLLTPPPDPFTIDLPEPYRFAA